MSSSEVSSKKTLKLNTVVKEGTKARSIPPGAWPAFGLWRFIGIVFAITLMALFITEANAQTFTGTISGRVTDQTGAVIPNATVTLTAVSTSQSRTAQTNDQGDYTFTGLQPGQYKIDVAAQNFAPQTVSAELAVAQQLRADVALGIGQVSGQVDVTSSEGGLAIETDNAQLSNVVNQRQVTELPLVTRNPYDLIGLSAGATDSPDRGTGSQRGAGFSVNGQRTQSGNFLLDGGENNDTFTSQAGQNVPLDTIQELRVQTNNYTAEYGRGAGFVANVVTKSGSNQFHGTVYEFNRNSKFAANDSFNNATGVTKPFFNRSQYGGSVGGPVIKNKTFFFGSTEFLKIRSSQNTIFFVPTPQLIAASSSATQSIFQRFPAPMPTGRLVTATDLGLTGANALVAANGSQLPGNTPLFGRVDAPLPRDAGAGSPQNTFLWTGRIDHNFSDRTSLSGRYAYERINRLDGTNSFSPFDGFTTGETNRNQNLTLTLTHTWSPKVVTETRFTYNRLLDNQPLGNAPVTPSFFVTGVAASQPEGNIVLPGYFTTLNQQGAAIPFGGPQNINQIFSSLSYTRGKHELKFGGQYLQLRDNRTFGAFENALADFQSVQNLINGTIPDYEIAVDPHGALPGTPLSSPFTPPSFTRHYRYNEWSAFAEDVFKIRPRLTLNLGLRYEYFGVLHSPGAEQALDANFYLGQGMNQFQQIQNGTFASTCSQTGNLHCSFYKPDLNNFAPRFGIAYDVFGDGKTVVRAGYGIFYDRNFGNVLFNVIQNPPNYAVLFAGTDNGTGPITANLDQFAALAPVSGQSYTSSARALDQNLRTAYANVWNISVQREVMTDYIVTLAYAGSNGIDLYSLDNINRRGSGAFVGLPGSARLNSLATNVNFRSNSGHSNYNALEASIDSHYIKSAGLQFRAAYTWSHAIDNESSTFGDSYLLTSAGAGVFGFQDAFNPAADKGNADFDVRHRFVGSFNWDVPFASHLRNHVLKALLNGYSTNGVVSFRTGYPFTLFDAAPGIPTLNNGQNPIRPLVFGPPPQIGPLTPSSPGTFNYINFGNSLGSPASVNGPFTGTLGRNTFRAPGLQTENISFFRNIKLSETKKLELRAEFFNIFNHANLFVVPGSNDIAGNFSSVQVQRGGTVDNISNSEQHRNIQLAVKFLF